MTRIHRIAVLPGDGVGQEVIPHAVNSLKVALGADAERVVFDHWPHGAEHTLKTGETITPEAMRELGTRDAIFVGAFGDPRIADNRHARDILLGMRFQLDLYVNRRPALALDDRLVPLRERGAKDVQMMIFRENTEGLYTGIGGATKVDSADEIAIEQEINTRRGVERIIRAAFEWAAAHGRQRVTLVDKANAMVHGHGLWRRVFALVAKEYAQSTDAASRALQTNALFVDNCALQMVRAPEQFDVIVTNNLFGDILSDLAASLMGGLGLAPSANYRPNGPAMFEPVHGSAPDIAGKNLANPMGAMWSGALMLEHLGYASAAERVMTALQSSIRAGEVTRDLGGSLSTQACAAAILARM